MKFEYILFDVDGGVARITLNRPQAGNALTVAMCLELMHAAIRCDEDPGIRAVLITGSGKMFSAGGDLKSFAASGGGIAPMLKEMTVYLHAATSRLARMDAPVVSAVNGAAAGAGLSLAVSADIAVAAESAKFTVAYTAVGLCPDGSSTYFLPRLIGLRRAQELMLTNRTLGAAEALSWNLVSKVVPDSDLLSEAGKLAASLAAGPTRAFGCVKRLLNESFAGTLETQMELESRGIVDMSKTRDGHEGISAFLERRRPAFTGS